MLPLAVILFLLFSAPTADAQVRQLPVLEQVETRYEVGGRPFAFRYTGLPQQLDAILSDDTGAALPFRAVLRDTPSGDRTLEFESPDTDEPGTYRIKVKLGLSTLADASFVRGASASASIDTTSSSNSTKPVEPVSKEAPPPGRRRRTTPTVLTPDMTYTTELEYTAESDGPVRITEILPINALVDAPEASSSIQPELLNLRMPFEQEYERTLAFGTVDPAEHFGIPQHDGTDYAVPLNVPIHAVDDGEIVPYREKNSYGITAAVQHVWGKTFYGHLSTTSAQLGTKVRKGDVIGLSGNTGLSSGPHLHFGMMIDEQMVDAARYTDFDSVDAVATKQLQWDMTLAKGESVRIKYDFTIPDSYHALQPLPFGPAAVRTHDGEEIVRENNQFATTVSGDTTTMDVLSKDPSYDHSAPFTVRDGVIVWLDAYDDRILHAYDTVTQTSFTQTLDEEDDILTIDDKQYAIEVNEKQVTLSRF